MSKSSRSRSNYKSQISRSIALQYFIALGFFFVAFLLFSFIAYLFVSSISWYRYNPFYEILRFVRDYIVVFLGIPMMAGWFYITYLFVKKPLSYLDHIITASEKLAAPTTEQIILPDVLKTVQDELNQVREMALRNAQLAKDAEQRKNDLIVYLAHDLKTPLTSVIGYLTLLRDETKISEELRIKYLSISLNKAERLEDLINEFFEITRFNLSGIELQYSNVNVTRLLEQLIFEFKPMLLEKKLECKYSISPNITVRCDADKIQRVFDNLLRNAVFYSFERTVIEISVTQTSAHTTIKFLNHGNTIPKEKLERVFEQFYRLDSSRGTNNGGAGLGLAIAKEIISLHHGTITAHSENDIVEFTVTLPLS
ncbi:HAMP domain-containing sensor histidine kinase [Lacrimispora xylanolytica]|uniref:histidine kinase n=1 Tax=Lacrimispora xylanolytica TaxID=29375 RepID=A0ABY7A801_9FIRM|nr:HAMP domain-containing sensor histidine kinase [Lacrimispora xylanolytica]WAJ22622.1 HAMP domain-containing sensor histidine kinase [Lacrimispora xylanolytica]